MKKAETITKPTSKETEMMKELYILKAENSRLREENEKKNEEINKLKSENTKLRAKIEKKNEEISLREEEKETLQIKMKELKKKINEITKQTTSREESLNKNKNKNKPQEELKVELLGREEIEQLKIVNKIGRGSQSKVYEVTREQHYALKVLLITKEIYERNSTTELFKSLQRLLQEYEILQILKHRNIIRSFGFFYGDEQHPPSILLEYCPSNLTNKVISMNGVERVCAIIEISLGMEAVHSSNLIHRDLKPENILIDSEGHIKLSDFGISCIAEVEEQTRTKTSSVGTLKFMSPELLQERTDYTNKVDVYSFGVVVFFILSSGKMPKINIADQSNGKQAAIPSNINEISRQMIKRCWSREAQDRPSFSDIIDFIKKNNFQLIDGVETSIDEIRQFTSI